MDWKLKKYPRWRSILAALFFVAMASGFLGMGYRMWANKWMGMPLPGVGVGSPSLAIWLAIEGAGATICLGAAMYALDLPRRAEGVRWYVRLLWDLPRRVLMLAQLGTTALMLAALGTQFFKFPLPLPK